MLGRALLFVESLLGPDRVLGRPAALFVFELTGSEFFRLAAVGFLGEDSVVDRCTGLGFSAFSIGALGANSLRVALPLLERVCR